MTTRIAKEQQRVCVREEWVRFASARLHRNGVLRQLQEQALSKQQQELSKQEHKSKQQRLQASSHQSGLCVIESLCACEACAI